MNNINDFKRALAFTLKWEGGYVNDSSDPGGETKWGISKKSYPDVDIAGLTSDDAAAIYIRDYWDKIDCDSLGYPLSAVAFDTGVLCGTDRVLGWLRKDPTPEGILSQRRDYLVSLVNKNDRLGKYISGWWNRMADLRKLVDAAKV